MNFKFKWIDNNGQPQGFLSKKGTFDGETLKLDDVELPVVVIVDVDFRTNFMFLSIAQVNAEPASCAFQVTSGKPEDIRAALGVARSAVWAELNRKSLEEKGEGHRFHSEKCRYCDATVDLTGHAPSPQVHCNFCHTISTLDEQRKGEKEFRLCDECGMYSKPRLFTIFYFYFLLVVYGWRSRQTWRCPGCMRGEAWKMLFGNLIFVLGVPVAMVQLFRAYGGTDIGGLYSGLDSANIKARKGDLTGAIKDYRKILEKFPASAGVKFNTGLALLNQQNFEGAAKMFEASLADCSNYTPAARGLFACYDQLGWTEELADLKAEWGIEEQTDELPAEQHQELLDNE